MGNIIEMLLRFEIKINKLNIQLQPYNIIYRLTNRTDKTIIDITNINSY